MRTTERQQYEELTAEEKRIYDSVIQSFPATSHDSAYNVAIQGGVRWNFIFK